VLKTFDLLGLNGLETKWKEYRVRKRPTDFRKENCGWEAFFGGNLTYKSAVEKGWSSPF